MAAVDPASPVPVRSLPDRSLVARTVAARLPFRATLETLAPLPGDVSASARYWKKDIIHPAVEVTPRGTIAIRDDPGFGYELDRDYIRHITAREESIG